MNFLWHLHGRWRWAIEDFLINFDLSALRTEFDNIFVALHHSGNLLEHFHGDVRNLAFRTLYHFVFVDSSRR